LELERYRRRMAGDRHGELPVGHPYVFQNDGEFIAGYFELFWRNPHAFAAQNPSLYHAFALLFGQDPRQAWPRDFPFYIEENRAFYQSGQPLWPTALTLPG